MQSRVIFKYIALTAIFLLALVMEIMPWPNGFQSVKPAWIVLIFMYWGLSIPNRVSIGWAFMIGILWDVVLGTILGAHALVLSIFAYLITKNHLVFRNLSLWMQSLLVIFFVFAIRFSIFLIEFLVHRATFDWREIFGAIISGILWPWLFLLLRSLRRRLGLS